jgi:hypothetical protein
MNAAAGRYGAFVRPQLAGTTSHWAVSMVDLETGKQTGWQDVGAAKVQPVISVTGNAMAVLNSGQLYVVRAPSLAAK